MLGMPCGGQRLRAGLKVREDHAQRVEYRHATRGSLEIPPHAELQQLVLDAVLGLRHADPPAQLPDRRRRIAPTPHAGQRRHARIVQAADVAAVNERGEQALGHHHVLDL